MIGSSQKTDCKWTVGVITAPREQGYYLDQTLRSLHNAGWEDVTVFAEPGSVIPENFEGLPLRVVVSTREANDAGLTGDLWFDDLIDEPVSRADVYQLADLGRASRDNLSRSLFCQQLNPPRRNVAVVASPERAPSGLRVNGALTSQPFGMGKAGRIQSTASCRVDIYSSSRHPMTSRVAEWLDKLTKTV